LTQEQLVLTVASSLGIPAIALRYQNVYGPGQSLANPYTGILSIFSREMLAGRPIEIFEDGRESRDFVHIDDIARANVAAIELASRECTTVNVGTGVSVTVLEVAERLLAAYGSCSELKVSGRFRVGDIRHNRADVGRLTSVLKTVPTISFNQGIATFCAWAQEQLSHTSEANSGYEQAISELEARGLMKG
jgi:dTDP-L-rhamnose 4-epimerase